MASEQVVNKQTADIFHYSPRLQPTVTDKIRIVEDSCSLLTSDQINLCFSPLQPFSVKKCQNCVFNLKQTS